MKEIKSSKENIRNKKAEILIKQISKKEDLRKKKILNWEKQIKLIKKNKQRELKNKNSKAYLLIQKRKDQIISNQKRIEDYESFKIEAKNFEKYVLKNNLNLYDASKTIYQNYKFIQKKLFIEETNLNIFLTKTKKAEKELKKINNIQVLAKELKEKEEKLNLKIKKYEEKHKKAKQELTIQRQEIKNNPDLRIKLNQKANSYVVKKKLQQLKLKKLKKDLHFVNKYFENKVNTKKRIAELETVINKNKLNIDNRQKKVNFVLQHYDWIQKELQKKSKSDKTIKNDVAISIKNLDGWYGKKQVLFNIDLEFPRNKVIAIIGPSGCGKSTLLRTLNRINDEISTFKSFGDIYFGNYNISKLRNIITNEKIQLTELRTKIGMIFQQPNPFPMSIEKNVMYGPIINGQTNKRILQKLMVDSLKKSALWDEVKSNLNVLGTSLSGGQQQRLCIARAIANQPEILLMDEPTSALDPIASKKVEDLILQLRKNYTIIMVTHSMQQAARISDYTAFLYQGVLIEFDKTKKIFNSPKNEKTLDYVKGKFG